MRDNSQLTFSSLYKNLTKSNNTSLKDISGDIKLLFKMTACLLCGKEAAGFASFVNLISDGSFIDAGSRIISVIKQQKELTYIDHVLRMREAYAAICLSAFFDTLNIKLPKKLYNQIISFDSEKKQIFEKSLDSDVELKSLEKELVIPDLVYNCDKVYVFLEELYNEMGKNLIEFVNRLAFAEEGSEKELRLFQTVMKQLPKDAVESFKDQYLMLCAGCPEFYCYIQFGKEREFFADYEEKYRKLLSLATRTEKRLVNSLEDLRGALSAACTEYKKKEVQNVVETLLRNNQKIIKQPVAEGEEELLFPVIEDAFIPQRFRLLSYTGKEQLAQVNTWEPLKIEEDMDAFWARYLLTPESTEKILLILGEPGGGKSLLTKVLAAQVSADGRFIVRIPLRDQLELRDRIAAGKIEEIICSQIEQDGDASQHIHTLKWVTEEFQGNPITLLFDGYDEVQQATGISYRNFMNDLRKFQDKCNENERPVRIVVTSRPTLIDKAEIPRETLVMKLEDFDERRQKKWIETWNRYNQQRLQDVGIEAFSLPTDSPEIEELVKQPLLLMMLAIYDADFEYHRNALRQKNNPGQKLDRTQLYDALLRRFIRRELRKGKRGLEASYLDNDDLGRKQMENEEMKRLGIAALGMFIREKLSITVKDLECFFQALEAKNPEFMSTEGRTLKSGELFFGSFFFIHDSHVKGTYSENTTAEYEPEASFVFLHKTFYEFLVADLVLENFFDYMIALYEDKKYKDRVYRQNIEEGSDTFLPCFLSLNACCLCIEPEILRMIAEWKDYKLRNGLYQHKVTIEEEALLVTEDISTVIREVFCEHFMRIRKGSFNQKRSLLIERTPPELYAVYLLNSVILQALICGSFESDLESWQYCSRYIWLNAPMPKKKDNSDRLPAFEMSEEILLQFMTMFEVETSKNQVVIRKRETPIEKENRSFLEGRQELATFLQSKTEILLYSLHDPLSPLTLKQENIEKLNAHGMGLTAEESILRLQRMIGLSGQLDLNCLIKIQKEVELVLRDREPDFEWLISWLLHFQQLVRRDAIYSISFISTLSHPIMHAFFRLPQGTPRDQIILLWIDIVKEFGAEEVLQEMFNKQWIDGLSGECFYACITALESRPAERGRSFSYTIGETNGHSPLWLAAYIIMKTRVFPNEDRRKITQPALKRIVKQSLSEWGEISDNQTLRELPAFLRECIRIGLVDIVKDYIKRAHFSEEIIFDETAPKQLYTWLELLDVEEIVGTDSILRKLNKHYSGRETYTPLTARLIRRLLFLDGLTLDVRTELKTLLSHFPELYAADSFEAVALLNSLAIQMDSNIGKVCEIIDETQDLRYDYVRALRYCLPQLCNYPMNGYSSKLLLSAAKFGVFDDKEIIDCYLASLDATLSTGDGRNNAILAETLCRLDLDTKKQMEKELLRRQPYILKVLPELSATIECTFNN